MVLKRESRRNIIIVLVLIQFFIFTKIVDADDSPLKVAFKPDVPVFQYIDESGNAEGLHIELMDEIVRELGVTVEYFPMNRIFDCLSALQNDQVDAVLGVPSSMSGRFYKTVEMSESESVAMSTNSFISNNDLTTFSKYKVGFEFSLSSTSIIQSMGARQYSTLSGPKQLLDALLQNKVDIILCDKNSMTVLLEELELTEEISIIPVYVESTGYTIAVSEIQTDFYHDLNDAIFDIRISGRYDEIRSKWIPEEKVYDLAALIRKIMLAAFIVIAVIISYILITNRIRILLKKEVAQKTEELHLSNKKLGTRLIQLQEEGVLRKAIVEHSPVGMALMDDKFNIQIINHRAIELSGLEDIRSNTPLLSIDFFRKLYSDCVEQLLAKNLASVCHVKPFGKTANEKFFRCELCKIDSDNLSVGSFLIISDVTREEREKEEMLERDKTQSLNRIIAGIAHEIKNPLMSIRTFVASIPSQKNDENFMKSFAEFVPRETDRINTLIESLINYAKPDRAAPQPVELYHAIQECKYLTQTIPRNTIIFSINCPHGLYIFVKQGRLKQALINLIVNAIASLEVKLSQNEVSENDPLRLEISTELDQDNVILSILDTGCGMNDETLKHCTEPFFTTKTTGSGLGLAMVAQFVHENGGEIRIESREQDFTKISMVFRRLEYAQ